MEKWINCCKFAAQNNKYDMARIIRNDNGYSLSKLLKELLPNVTKSMDILVGYFYFSGLKEIYAQIEKKPIRLLVGLDIDHDVLSELSAYDFFATKSVSSTAQTRKEFYDSLKTLFNDTSFFENDEASEAFRIYYKKIKEGTLEIRKTKKPCHAKMYIFDHNDNLIMKLPSGDENLGQVITGSSNLTRSGLQSNGEINVLLKDDDDYKYAKEVFEELWDDAVMIADKDTIEDFEGNVIKKIWLDKIPTPYLVYLRVLYEYFHLDVSSKVRSPHEITGTFMDLQYQKDAIREAIERIKTHNGVIVADVVGLGKSIIGSAVAYNMHLNTIIIAPPHLVPQWEDYRTEFRVTASVFSRGNMERVLEFYRSHNNSDEPWLIIVDEAHKFRNEYIQDYAMLHEICKGNKVVLLSATPFNNTPADIFAMVKLFQNPTKSTLQTVNNLGAKFANLIGEYKKIKKNERSGKCEKEDIETAINHVGAQIRRIIEPIVIRRSRTDLEKIPAYKTDLKNQGFEFPIVNPPELMTYDLGRLEKLYITTLLKISPKEDDIDTLESLDSIDKRTYFEVRKRMEESPSFQAARYKPLLYVKEECKEKVKEEIDRQGWEYNLFMGSQKNMAQFMRKLLVHRFESSQHAFKLSLSSLLANCRNIVSWIEKRHKVPIYKQGMLPNIEEMYLSTDDTVEEEREINAEGAIEKLKAKGMFEVSVEYLSEDFGKDLDKDIEILEELQKEWKDIQVEDDPKLKHFVEIIKKKVEEEPKRKIVVFSQFADTVDYLAEQLEKEQLPVFYYSSRKASRENKEIIKTNFDAGLAEDKQADEYKVLVATDAISEGYNLHRAGAIINFDIPYNPTRIIQRVGRINRINKKVFDELYIFNYFPTFIGEKETHTKEISTLKMHMIHAIMGEDTKYLTSDEELQSFMSEQYKRLMSEQESESWDTPYRALLDKLEKSPVMKEALELPTRSKVHRLVAGETPSGIIAFAKKGNDYVFKIATEEGEINDISPEEAFGYIKAEEREKGYSLSASFNSYFHKLKESLFVHESDGEQAKTKRDALERVRIIRGTGVCQGAYIEDLITAIEHDTLSGYSLRRINQLKQAEYALLPTIVESSYVQAALNSLDKVSNGNEVLIIAEEMQNVNDEPKLEI